MNKLHLFLGGILLATSTGFAHQQASSNADAAMRRDIYAIYSRIISSTDEMVLIEGTTVTEVGGYGTPVSCIQPPPEDVASFNEVLKDYEFRRNVPATLNNDFTLDRPYQILTASAARTFLDDARRSTPQVGTGTPNPNPLFPKARRVFRLSDVFFNGSRTMALVYISEMSTTVDGGGRWKVFKRSEPGQWNEVRSGRPSPGEPIWRTCGWSAGH